MLINRYKIQNELNRSRYAVTYLAYDEENKINVIIKELIFEQMPDWKAIELFEREAITLKQLKHNNIPIFIDYFSIEKDKHTNFYLVQSYFEGITLKKYIQEQERLNEENAIKNMKKLLNILEYIHSINPPVIHRDIKPENIIIQRNGDLALVDFGSVKALEKGDMTIVGTYGYMPLEQFGGEAYPASDIYSLGMVMVYWLTHTNPSDLPKNEGKVNFRSYCSISDEFYQIIDKMIEPDIQNRFKKVKDVVYALNNIGKGIPFVKQIETKKKLSVQEKKIIRWVGGIIILLIASLWIFAAIRQQENAEQSRRMNEVLKNEYTASDIYKNRQPPQNIKPTPNGFREAVFGISFLDIKKLYPEIKNYQTSLNYSVNILQLKNYFKIDYYGIKTKDIFFRKTDIMGYDFETFYLFKENKLIRVVSTAILSQEQIFNKLERSIISQLENSYGFASDAKVKNQIFYRNIRNDYYVWDNGESLIKLSIDSYIPDAAFRNLKFMKSSFKIIIEYTSKKIIQEIENAQRQREILEQEAERKKKEAEEQKRREIEEKMQRGKVNRDL